MLGDIFLYVLIGIVSLPFIFIVWNALTTNDCPMCASPLVDGRCNNERCFNQM